MRRSSCTIRILSLCIINCALCIFFSSCKFFQKKSNPAEEAIAIAYDKYLLESDIEGLVPQGSSEQDSITITRNFINNWLRQQAVLHIAESNLNEEKKDVEKQLQEYRNSLIRYAYESELVKQKLDTVVSDEEVEKFYKDNPANFQLRNNIIKVAYVKLNKKTPKLDKVKEWFRSGNARDQKLLEDYCRQYALNYFFDDETWLLFDDLLKEIPIKTYDQEQFLQNNRNIEIQDSTSLYLVNIKGFRIKNSLSPLNYESNNIRTMIINQRKLKLLEQLEKDAFREAEQAGAVRILKSSGR